MSYAPKVISTSILPTDEARWLTLKKIRYSDPEGKERAWEFAERTTRKSSGVDAVAIFAILKSKANSFPLSTVVIEQYRPPIDKFIVELPAGLVDDNETPENAAIRELQEETGLKAEKVIESSSLIVSDPGMTNANMKLIVLSVLLEDKLVLPDPNLDVGEFIVRRVVEISKLSDELKEYDSKGFIIDARLSHLAFGLQVAEQIRQGKFD